MAKEKITIQNNLNDPFSRLLNKVEEVKPQSNLNEILEEIAEICSETNEDLTVNPEQTPTK